MARMSRVTGVSIVSAVLLAAVAVSFGLRQGAPSVHGDAPADARGRRAGAEALVPAVNVAPAPGPAPDGMVWIPGGTYWRGCADCGMPDAEPVHAVEVGGFWMDETPVTNAAFAGFVRATGYVTVAERPLDPRDFPGVPPEALVPGSAVFVAPSAVQSLHEPHQWWRYLQGASWRHPEGPGSSSSGRMDHPVVHVAWEDAVAYLQWAGKELPSEAQFEFAARGGLDRNLYAWGNDLTPGGRRVANTWQGTFPTSNTADDGYRATAPVTAFPPNGFGLHDMGGNVWQWCADWYQPDYYRRAPAGVWRNPRGPADSVDPAEPGVPKRVQRGGSFLCADQYCMRYLVGSRGKGAADTGSSNVGFRGIRTGSG